MNIQKAQDILGIDFNDIINKAYRKKSKEVHPDSGGTEEDFIKIKKARDYLINKFSNADSEGSLDNVFAKWSKQEEDKRRNQTEEEKYREKIKDEIILEVYDLKTSFKNDADFYKYVEKELREAGYVGNILYTNKLDTYMYKYYLCIKQFKELYKDNNTYQLRGKYHYIARKEKGKLKQEYIGKELPESAMGELKARERKKICINKAIGYVNDIFR